ncbi:Uncharacterised protein [Serratia fonticola]|nr:Uncharacterised protein [Serratia fonticola]CAI1200000.1 Uncharacterised protein [Serratia fonticola]
MQSCSINKSHFENATMFLSDNILRLKKSNHEIKLSKNQSKLMACLISEESEKKNIINYIWGSRDCKSRENSYSQLVFKTKKLLIDNGLPSDLIMTIPNYGLCINKNHIEDKNSHYARTMSILNDPGIHQ